MNKKMNWNDAMKYAESLGEGWRLPSLKELQTLFDYNKGVCVLPSEQSGYWSSTTGADYPSVAWYVYFGNGYVYGGYKSHGNFCVRCVRGGQFDYHGNLIVMGLTEGQEQITLNEDGTITDNCTGLTWEAA